MDERFKRFFNLMLEKGVYLAPSAFEACFTSLAHGDKEIEATLGAAEYAFKTPEAGSLIVPGTINAQ